MKQNNPFQVPGFGCSYWQQYAVRGRNADFELVFTQRGETSEVAKDQQQGWTLLTSLEAGQAKMSAGKGPPLKISSSEWVAYKRNNTHRLILHSQSFLLKTVGIHFHERSLEALAQEHGIEKTEFANTVKSGRALEKSIWIEEVLHRYVFERCVARKERSLSSNFCEAELLKELYYAHKSRLHEQTERDPERELTRITLHHASPQFQRALAFIEKNLHSAITAEDVAQGAALSESSLLRVFRHNLGTTPMKHVWRRRLQEARLLLQTGRYSVLEVAHHVHYSNPSAFTQAFQREFGDAPAAQIPRA